MSARALALSVDVTTTDQVIPTNTSTTIRWTSSGAKYCWSRGGWGGGQPLQGSYKTGPLTGKTWFGVTCSVGDQRVTDGITIVARDADDGGSGGGSSRPSVSVSASPVSVKPGGTSTLSWTSSGAKWCWSRGQFGGGRPLQGSFTTPAITENTWFAVVCSDGTVRAEDAITLTIAEGSGSGEVSVDLSASPRQIRPGESASLSWSSENADSCTASGAGWSGWKPRNGSADTGALSESTYYRLTCQSGQQTAVSSVTVQVGEVPLVRWQPPTQNVDGSPLTDLAGYWFYWGDSPGNYSGRKRIWNPDRTQYRPDALASGRYYVAVTALNQDGDESAHSNEIQIKVP